MQLETEYYLYNVDAKAFFTEGNAWGTQASVGATGLRVKISEETVGDAANPSYIINDFSLNKNAWKQLFVDSSDAMYVDHGSQGGNSTAFAITKNGSNYRIQPDTHNVAGNGTVDMVLTPNAYVGAYLNAAGETVNAEGTAATVLYPTVNLDAMPEGLSAAINWIFIPKADGDAYNAAIEAYNAATSLRAAIEDALAKYPGIDLSEQIAVYNNTASTAAELKAAEASIADAIVEYELSQGNISPENPADLTAKYIPNPDFTNANLSGWSGTAFSRGGTVADNAEHYEKDFDTYIDIEGLPAGVYAFSCNAFSRSGWAQDDYDAWKAGKPTNDVIYLSSPANGEFSAALKHASEGLVDVDPGVENSIAVDGVDADGNPAVYYLPNTMKAADEFYFRQEGEPYRSTLVGAVAEGEKVRIGVKKNGAHVGGDWAIFDDFKLLYYGDSDAAYQALKENVLEYANLTIAEETYYGQPDIDAYEATLESYKAATSAEDLIGGYQALNEAKDAVLAGTDAYNTYVALYYTVDNYISDGLGNGDVYDKLCAYVQSYADENDEWTEEYGFPNGVANYIINILEDEYIGRLSGADIKVETEYLRALYQLAMATSLQPGDPIALENPGFEEPNGRGWSGGGLDANGNSIGLTSWRGGSADNYCAEAFQQNFDVYQEIDSDLPAGVYEVSVQAFYRTAANADAWNAFQADPEMKNEAKVYSEVYLNDFFTPVRNVMEIQFDENLANNCYSTPAGTYTLDGMASASAAFSLPDESQNFTMSAYGLVTDGKMRIGIRKLAGPTTSAQWTLWDNFKLTFWGKDEEALYMVITNYSDRVANLDETLISAADWAALVAAQDVAENASGSEDMFNALIAFVAAYNKAVSSIEAYQALNEAADNLYLALTTSPASADVIAEATDFYNNVVLPAVQGRTLSGDEALALIPTIEEWIMKLRVPEYNGTEDNPADLTDALIVNPSFDNDNGEGWSGTTMAFQSYQNAEHYDKNFDTYQEIMVGKTGTYRFSATAAYRAGSIEEDYESWKSDAPEANIHAFLYAENGDTKVSAPFKHMFAGSVTVEKSEENPTMDLDYPVNGAQSRYLDAEGNLLTGVDDDSENVAAKIWVPNTMESFEVFNHSGDVSPYYTSLIINVTDADNLRLRLGIKKTTNIATNWAIFDDFKLEYLGETGLANDGDPVGIDKVTGSTIVRTDIFTVDGRRVATLQQGINILKTTDANGNVQIQKVLVK